jgi:hypothetical protein
LIIFYEITHLSSFSVLSTPEIQKTLVDFPLESPHLVEVMVGHNSYGCREIQASDVSPDGDRVTGICISYFRWKPTGLRAEEQIIALPCHRICVGFSNVTTEGQHVFAGIHIGQEVFKTLMVPNINLLPIVKACPFKMLIVHFETQGMDQV